MNSHEPNPNEDERPVISEPPRKSPWSTKAKVLRLLWGIVDITLWRFSPVFCWGFRRTILRCFGARVGRGVRVHPSVKVIIPWNIELRDDVVVHERAILYALGEIRVGQRTEIGPLSHICAGTHDFTSPAFTLLRQPITIGSDCLLGICSFVAPDVTIANNTTLMPRCAIYADTEPGSRYIGNPGKMIPPDSSVSLAHDEAVTP
jgi:putative colanic acid biosynthesis acetyltransferase WcaF